MASPPSLERYRARAQHARSLTTHLEKLADSYTDATADLLRGLAHRIDNCNHATNHRTVIDGKDRYVTKLWACNSKLCPGCSLSRGVATRKVLNARLQAAPPQHGEKLYFVTLTVPNIGLPLRQARAIVNYAWSLLRKRRLWLASVSGGSKTEEFTLTKRGYHYHLHLLCKSRWLGYQQLRAEWTDAVEAAFDKFGHRFECRTRDGLLIIKCIVVKNLKRVLFEVTKYVTKTESWSRLNARELVECSLIERWHRMFETFGDWAEHEGRGPSTRPARSEQREPPIVHNEFLTDGKLTPEAFTGWRRTILDHGFDEYTLRLAAEIADARRFRLLLYEQEYPHLTLEPVDL